jgi:hypothetical protein
MAIARTITTEAEWEALPVGTLARVGYIEHDDDGNEVDEGKVMSVLRVEGDARANAGDCMLAGGKYWSEVWAWEQGVTAMDPTALPEPGFETPGSSLKDAVAAVDAAISAHTERVEAFNKTPYSEYVKLPPDAHPAPTPARDIVVALQVRGWGPQPV